MKDVLVDALLEGIYFASTIAFALFLVKIFESEKAEAWADAFKNNK